MTTNKEDRFYEDDPDTLIWPQESVPLSEEELKYKAKLLKSIKARQKK